MSLYRSIDGTYTFYLNTHLPSTASEGDADALPTYEVYEEDTDTTILSGSMAKLNDAGTLGQFVKKITLSAANGFEAGKIYGVRMRALVETVPMCKTEVFGIWPSTIPSTIGIDGVPVIYVEGPFILEVIGSGTGGLIRRSAGDPLAVAVTLKAGRRRINLAGKTPTAQMLDSAGASAAAVTAAKSYDAGGEITLSATVPAEPGIYRVTVKPSSTDWTYGPLLVEVV